MRRLVALLSLVALLCPAAAQAAVRRIFVTSASGTGDLGSWPEAGLATGLAAGDAICQTLALNAGLPNAAGFRAWLSSTTTDAYCRIHNLTGKRSANCGQPSLPAAAGPWVRVDGIPFGADITQLLSPSYVVWTPPRLDETGTVVHAGSWTGTFSTGANLGDTCADWTSSGGTFPIVGSSDRTALWGFGGASACSGLERLTCLETGVGDPLPPFANWGRLAFLTSATGTGNLASWPQAGGQTGLAAGDAICQNLASAAGLRNPTSFKAWLSSGSVDARDRFVHDGPWMRLDRVRIAPHLAGLTDGFLNTAINLTETGEFIDNFNVWTGTQAAGTADAERCSDWTSASSGSNGLGGASDAADSGWTFYSSPACDFTSSYLYCLQDLPLVFGDGFESGSTAVWSSVVP